ncbi:MAG TPA: DUF3363 domain-containing protein [Halothiobacillus sp.]|nr:DUF3363 domain-containing protein [Halothiobacillus sp.]
MRTTQTSGGDSSSERESPLKWFIKGIKDRDSAKMLRAVKTFGRNSRLGGKFKQGGQVKGEKNHFQRVAIRLTYSPNRTPGQWAAHGKYISRDSALEVGGGAFGVDGALDAVSTLRDWQTSDDPRMFKMIISPEFGEKMDLKQYTRDVMSKMQKDLGAELAWVAVDHYNTDNPHVHVAIRGIDKSGHEVNIPRDYIKSGLREASQNIATQHIGYRQEVDIIKSLDRQINQNRFTGLDRELIKHATSLSAAKHWCHDESNSINFKNTKIKEADQLRLIKRLTHLEQMGLAKKISGLGWEIRGDFEQALRVRQMSEDRLKTKFQHGKTLSDPDMPLVYLDSRTPLDNRIFGRVVGVGEDEAKMKPYALIEGVDGKVYYLNTNQYQKVGTSVHVQNLKSGIGVYQEGDAESFSRDPKRLMSVAATLARAGQVVPHKGLKGWVGECQNALAATQSAMLQRGVMTIEENGSAVWRGDRQRQRGFTR